MKKTAELFYILFRMLFQVVSWLMLALTVIESVIQILRIDIVSIAYAYTNLETAAVDMAGQVLETDLSAYLVPLVQVCYGIGSVIKGSWLPVLILSFLGMYGCRFLQDHVDQRKPVYLGLVELTAETTAWALKCMIAYISVGIVCQVASWIRDPEVLNGFTEPVEVLAFLLSTVTVPLILAGCSALVCLVCTVISHKLAKS